MVVGVDGLDVLGGRDGLVVSVGGACKPPESSRASESFLTSLMQEAHDTRMANRKDALRRFMV